MRVATSAKMRASCNWRTSGDDCPPIVTSESGSSTGSGRHNVPSSAVTMALVAPMPRASERTAASVKPGLRRNARSA